MGMTPLAGYYGTWNNTLKYQYFYDAEGNLVKKLDVHTAKAVNCELGFLTDAVVASYVYDA